MALSSQNSEFVKQTLFGELQNILSSETKLKQLECADGNYLHISNLVILSFMKIFIKSTNV